MALIKSTEGAHYPSLFGKFMLTAFQDQVSGSQIPVLYKNNINNSQNLLVRIQSKCIGDVFSAYRCDCREQLEMSLAQIEKEQIGMLIYLDQEGRGIGLSNEILAWELQDHSNQDTVQANATLNLPTDLRAYNAVKEILQYYNIKSIRLMTNNPAKVNAIKQLGINISSIMPVVATANEHNFKFMETLRVKLKHKL
ncbi:GTP cyclohydrolase II [Spiroplasma endosymbiont of Labia minor]|uniref:GTP cyclohydrolase II n=1 Tax=Spiroplasma endosymbiont of Labia minor TaxID=3066305 RepID=UPI0030CF7606